MNKKIIIKKIISVISLTFLILPVLVFAQNPLTNLGAATPNSIKGASLPEMIGTIIKTVISLLGIIMVVYIIYGGFLWTTAGGDTSKVQKAKDIIKNSIIGVIIILASYSITEFVIDSLSRQQ